MDSKSRRDFQLVCSLFDVGAGEHGPLFCAASFDVAWRNVDQFLKSVETEHVRKAFVLCVHANFFPGKLRETVVPAPEPMYFSSFDRAPTSVEQVLAASQLSSPDELNLEFKF